MTTTEADESQLDELVVLLEPEDWVTSVKCTTLLIIFVMTLSSNMFVLWLVLLRSRWYRYWSTTSTTTTATTTMMSSVRAKQRTPGPLSRVQLFVVHLAIADILVALLNILPQLAWVITVRFEGGFVLCKLVKYAQVLVLYLSTYILTGMSLDRLISMRAIYAQWQIGMQTSRPTRPRAAAAAAAPLPFRGGLVVTAVKRSGPKGRRAQNLLKFNNSHHSRAGYRKVAKLLIALAWFVSAVFALPQVFIFSYVPRAGSGSVGGGGGGSGDDDDDNDVVVVLDRPNSERLDGQGVQSSAKDSQQHYDCLADFSWHPYGMEIYVTSFVIIILGMPTLLMLFCYGYMCVIILRIQQSYKRQQSQQSLPVTPCAVRGGERIAGVTETSRRAAGAGGDNHQPSAEAETFSASTKRLTAAKVRLVQMTFSVVLCFIICWSPFCIAELVRAYTLPVDNAHASPLLMVLLLLASLNSAVNPWIYAAFCMNRSTRSRLSAKMRTSSAPTSAAALGAARSGEAHLVISVPAC